MAKSIDPAPVPRFPAFMGFVTTIRRFLRVLRRLSNWAMRYETTPGRGGHASANGARLLVVTLHALYRRLRCPVSSLKRIGLRRLVRVHSSRFGQ